MQGKLLQKLKTRPVKILGDLTKETTPYHRDIWPTCNSWCGILQLIIFGLTQEGTWKILGLLLWSKAHYGLSYWQPLVFYRWYNPLNWPFFFLLNLAETSVYITVANEAWASESQHCGKTGAVLLLSLIWPPATVSSPQKQAPTPCPHPPLLLHKVRRWDRVHNLLRENFLGVTGEEDTGLKTLMSGTGQKGLDPKRENACWTKYDQIIAGS